MTDDHASQLDRVAMETGLEASLQRVDELERELAATKAGMEEQRQTLEAERRVAERLIEEFRATQTRLVEMEGRVKALNRVQEEAEVLAKASRHSIAKLEHEMALPMLKFLYRRLKKKQAGA